MDAIADIEPVITFKDQVKSITSQYILCDKIRSTYRQTTWYCITCWETHKLALAEIKERPHRTYIMAREVE